VIATAYPASPAARTRWIIDQRPARNSVSTDRPYAFFTEEERMETSGIARVSTIFLTNRECPWKCLMCDLWRNTAPAPAGSIPSGSFFDRGAIPRSDWNDIVALCLPFEHLILECHPKLIGPDVLEFAAMFQGQLEIAMGLETAQPLALEKLNKRITVADFTRATRFLRRNQIAVRTFLLVSVPFIPEPEQPHWLKQSIRTALDAGADVISLIPTRTGNGALDALQQTGDFREPALRALEDAHDFGIRLGHARVFADTWDLARFSPCPDCAEAREDRLVRMNLSHTIEPRIRCSCES
jgi:archaeosine synthase beta-subunit